MKYDLSIVSKDSTHCRVICGASVAQELADHFSYEVPGAKYSALFKSGMWDGRTKLFNQQRREIYFGLIPYVKKYAAENDYTFEDTASKPKNEQVTTEIITKFAKTLNLYSQGKPITIHDYQIEAVVTALRDNRRLLLSPTSSGKSLIIYMCLRWFSLQNKRILLLVPSKQLVAQLFTDFQDYSSENEWDVDANAHMIYGGKEKVTRKPITISTWQSLYKIGGKPKPGEKKIPKGGILEDGVPHNYFEQFDVVIGDEAHLYKAESIVGILSRCINAEKRIATTGTLDSSETNKLVLEGLFGPVFRVISTRQLMDDGKVAQLSIRALQLSHSDEVRKNSTKMTFDEEIKYLEALPSRNKFLAKLAVAQPKNTLLLYRHIEHGQDLFNQIDEMAGDTKRVFLVNGDTDLAVREEIRAITEKFDNIIIVASYGTFSTGINIRNLHYIIFGAPLGKSRVLNLQSIGRGLRIGTDKFSCVLMDVSDDLSWKKYKNFSLLHSIERLKTYASEKMEYKLVVVPLK